MQGPVAGAEVKEQPAQARALAGRERGEEGLLLLDRLDFHLLDYLRVFGPRRFSMPDQRALFAAASSALRAPSLMDRRISAAGPVGASSWA